MRAGRKASLILLSNALGALLGYAALVLIGRYVPPASYGFYLFALGLTGILSILSNLGLGAAHQRHIAQGTPVGQALGVLVRLRAMWGGALMLLFIAGWAAWTTWSGKELTDATTPALVAAALVLHLVSGVRQVFLDTWQGQQRVHRVELIRFIDSWLTVVLLANAVMLLAHLTGRWEVVPGVGPFWARTLGWSSPPNLEATALLLAACYLIAKLVTFIVAAAWSLRDHVTVAGWDTGLARSYVRFAVPVAITGVLVLVLQSTDTVLLGFFWTSREVGLYGAAQKLATLVLLASTAVAAVLFPRFSQLHQAGDVEKENATFDAAQRYLLLLGAPVAAAMVALPRQGLHVGVGDAYLDAAGPLRLLATWAFVTAMALPLGSRLLGAGRTDVMLRYSAFNAIANVALNFWLVPEGRFGAGLGASGAALATLLSTSGANLYLRWQGRRVYGLSWLDAQQFRIFAAGALACGFWFASAHWVAARWFDRVWELAAWGVAGTLVFVAGLAILGELKRSDLHFLRRAAHPRELFAELRGK